MQQLAQQRLGWLMEALSRWVRRLETQRAQSTVEYALVGALVVIAAATALTLLGEQVTSVFEGISKTLGSAGGAAPR